MLYLHTGLFYTCDRTLTVLSSFASDITFIHEGNKTFLDNLLNFDKLVSRLGERCLVTLHVRGLVISCVSLLSVV